MWNFHFPYIVVLDSFLLNNRKYKTKLNVQLYKINDVLGEIEWAKNHGIRPPVKNVFNSIKYENYFVSWFNFYFKKNILTLNKTV